MTRRMNLILAILEWLSKQPGVWATLPKTLAEYPEDVMEYHIEMCVQAGYINRSVETSGYTRLTWQGHDKLEKLQATVREFCR